MKKENDKINKEIENIIFYLKDTPELADKVSLIVNEIDFNIKNDIGENILFLAVRRNMKHVAETMFNYLVNNNLYDIIKEKNNEKENLLMLLVKKDNENLFKEIIKNKELLGMLNEINKFNKTVNSLIKDYKRDNMQALINEKTIR